jgi:hypothetical protein
LLDVFGRDKADGVEVLKAGGDEFAEVGDFGFGGNEAGKALPGVAGTFDEGDGVHEGSKKERGTITQRSQREEHRGHRGGKRKDYAENTESAEFAEKIRKEGGFIAQKTCDGKPYLHCAARRAKLRRGKQMGPLRSE